jgi:hypothetical protein
MKALNIKTHQTWYFRLHGKQEPKFSEGVAVEKIFHEYGITEIWGRYKKEVCNTSTNEKEVEL